MLTIGKNHALIRIRLPWRGSESSECYRRFTGDLRHVGVKRIRSGKPSAGRRRRLHGPVTVLISISHQQGVGQCCRSFVTLARAKG